MGNEIKYRVGWESKITGYRGHGTWLSNLSTVQSWVNTANRKYPNVKHWVEKQIENKKSS